MLYCEPRQCAELLGSSVSALGGDNGAEWMNRFCLASTTCWGLDCLFQPWEMFGIKLAPQAHVPSSKLEDIGKSQRCPPAFPDGCSVAPLGEL